MKAKVLLNILFLFCWTFASYSQHATTILLEGKIGRASVVMEITSNGTTVSGNYYYKRFKKNIPLDGQYIDEKTIELTYVHWNTEEKFLLKNIRTETEYIYTGTWQNQNSQSPLSVRLKTADISKITAKNTYVKRTDLSEYDYSRLADIKLFQDSIQKINSEFSVTWLSDSIAGFSFFRINKNTAVKGIDSINIFLEAFQFSELVSYLDCGGSEYTSDISSLYIRGHLLSFAVSNSYECGGAHPDFGTSGYTFNMETARQLELTDFLFFGKTDADESMGSSVVELLTKLYPEDMTPATNEDEEELCDYNEPDVWDYPAWYLTEKGLYLYPYFARVARCCDGAEFSTIPYKTLIKYRNPKAVIPMKY